MDTTDPTSAAPFATPSQIPPSSNHKLRQVLAGVFLLCFGLAAIPVALLGLFVTANACGPFADSCDDYGKSDPAAPWFGLLLLAAPCAIVAGSVVLVVGSRRPKARALGFAGYPTQGAPVPGWYADQTGAPQTMRYWDGNGWTEYTRPEPS